MSGRERRPAEDTEEELDRQSRILTGLKPPPPRSMPVNGAPGRTDPVLDKLIAQSRALYANAPTAEEVAAKEAAARAERDRRAVDKALLKIPPRYRWAAFDAPELPNRVKPAKAIEAVRKVAERMVESVTPDHDDWAGGIVTLVGPAGAGKTVSACCIFRLFVSTRGANAKFSRFDDSFTLESIRRNSGLGEEPEIITDARSTDFLVIDDLGAEPVSPDRTIAELIHHRHAHDGMTVITTGLTPELVSQRYGDGVARRVFEGTVIRLGGGK